MPGVDTMEALFAAAEVFDATPLGLQADPDAEAAVRESLRRTGLVLLGEMHGVAQTPVLLEELMPWLQGWIAECTLPEPDWEQNPP